MKTKAYVNGIFMAEDKARVSILDRGLNYGDGLFETIKAMCGAPLFMKEHMERLKRGIKALGMKEADIKPLLDDVRSGAIKRLLKANRLLDCSAYVRMTVTRGMDQGGHLPSGGAAPTLIIRVKPLDEDAIRKRQEKGISAVLIRGYAPSIPGIKTLNYLPNVLGKIEASRRKADEGIFIDRRGRASEGTSSNLFIVSKGAVITPPVEADGSTGVLPGITRKHVMALAWKAGIKMSETSVTLKKLNACDEAFVTNSISGIVPLNKIDGCRVGRASRGEITTALLDAYERLIRERLKSG